MSFYPESLPELKAEGGFYHRPYAAPKHPKVNEDYLPDNVRVHFEFGPHLHADHFDATEERLKEADIYIPEASGYKPATIEIYRKLVAGQINLQPSQNSYKNRSREVLFGSEVIICLADANHQDLALLPQPPKLDTETLEGLAITSYDRAYHQQLRTDVRNVKIIHNLGQIITEAVRNNSVLKSKPTVNVLATLGSAHIPIYDSLASNPHVSAAQWSGDRPTLPLTAHLNVRRKITSNQPVSREEVLKRALTYNPTFDVVSTRRNHAQVRSEAILLETIFKNMPNALDALFRFRKGLSSSQELAYFKKVAEESAQQART